MLSFDVYNPSQEPVSLSVRIDDKREYPEYNDRYNKSFIMNSGLNHIAISCDSLVASITNRRLDIGHIYRFFMFTAHLKIKTTLYIDAIKLQQDSP